MSGTVFNPSAELPLEIRELLRSILKGDWTGYSLAPIPDARDLPFEKLTEYFVSADADHRSALRASLRQKHADLLGGFATRMAALSVREDSPSRLRTALFALALAGDSPESDWRDLGTDLEALNDASRRLRGSTRQLFFEAAELAGDRTRGQLRAAAGPAFPPLRLLGSILSSLIDFISRPIPTTAPVAAQTEDGFRYVPKNPELVEEAKRIIADDKRRRGEDA